MKPSQIGTYRQRVILLDIPETTQDSYGQPSLSSIEIGRFWAEVRPLRGNEQLNVRQIWPTASHIVHMRAGWARKSRPPRRTRPG